MRKTTPTTFIIVQKPETVGAENVDYWTAYDMSYQSKRIEVKSTRYVHPWNKQISKVRTFSIEPSDNSYREYAKCGVNAGKKRSRQSEIYVFCLNGNMDIASNNPLRVDDWVFYVIPTFVINDYCKDNPELIIGAIFNAENYPPVFEIRTAKNGEPVMPAQSSSHNRYYLQYTRVNDLWTVAEAANAPPAGNRAIYIAVEYTPYSMYSQQ